MKVRERVVFEDSLESAVRYALNRYTKHKEEPNISIEELTSEQTIERLSDLIMTILDETWIFENEET